MRSDHYLRTNGARCDAFPSGIPDEIQQHRNPHTSPFPGDHGLPFEPIEPPAKATTRPLGPGNLTANVRIRTR
jgi:hypothetical protein